MTTSLTYVCLSSDLHSQFLSSPFSQHHSYPSLYLDDTPKTIFVLLSSEESSTKCLKHFHSLTQCSILCGQNTSSVRSLKSSQTTSDLKRKYSI